MSAATTYTIENVLNALLRGGAFQAPTNVYIALHTGDPGDNGANEVTPAEWPSYVRLDSADGGTLAAAWSDPAVDNGESLNQIQRIYPVFNGPAPLIVSHFSLWDAASGGNCLLGAALTTARQINSADVFVVDTEKLTARLT